MAAAQSEEAPLLPTAEPVVQTKSTKGRVALGCSVVGLVLIAAKGGLRHEASPTGAGAEELRIASPSMSNTAQPTLNRHSNQYSDFKNTAFANHSIGIYKRTHATAHAAEDVIFQQQVVGNLGFLELTGSYGDGGVSDDEQGFPEAMCMKRAAGIAAANFSVHDVETERFHTGTYKPEVWWKYISRVHGPFNPYDFKGWNEFMARSIPRV